MTVDVKVINLGPVLQRFRPETILRALKRMANNTGEIIVKKAVGKAPVDTGLLRASLAHEVKEDNEQIMIDVGSNVEYAIFVEYGTGALTDWPGGGKGYHFPPPAKLERWAQRHGFPPGGGFVVARAIARRGGLPPKRYIRDAIDESIADIEKMAQAVAQDIEREFGGES